MAHLDLKALRALERAVLYRRAAAKVMYLAAHSDLLNSTAKAAPSHLLASAQANRQAAALRAVRAAKALHSQVSIQRYVVLR